MHEVFEHTADLGLRVRAASYEALLAEAAAGLFEIIAGDLGQITPRIARTFSIPGTDRAYLLLDWMGELLAAFEIDRLLFREFDVAVHEQGITATARGEPYDPAVHRLAHEIKAVTQHELDVRQTPAGWEATLIVDI
jgi:SHS2 domain-containing protein